MHTLPLIRTVLLALACITASCTHYSSVTEKRPGYNACALEVCTRAGKLIEVALKKPEKLPQAQIGKYLDAAAMAGAALKQRPDDQAARKDYNFAVGRVFETIHDSGLEPWKTPLICPGANREWKLAFQTDKLPQHDPSYFRILPTDRYKFKGTLVKERTVKDGLGAPMVATSKGFDPTKYDPFIQGKHVYYGVTGLLNFNAANCSLSYHDPLMTENVSFEGHSYPLAADFTAPLALALAELKPRKNEIKCFVRPGDIDCTTRLARLQSYDPKKIPIVLVHGLGDSHATWAPLIETLRGDPFIRQNYQFWFFSYPTGYPYPRTASVLRKQLDAIKEFHPDHKKIVVLGHSMGGMIARDLITDSGMKIWNAFYDLPPEKLPLSEHSRRTVAEAFIFQHRPEISRVVFLSASHRGADLAKGFIGRLGSWIIGSKAATLENSAEEKEAIALMKPNAEGKKLTRPFNSIDALHPDNRFVTTINTIPTAKGIPYHSIIGDRGKGGNLSRTKPISTDGIVPYWSSHIDGAESELIVPSGHWSNQNPLAIAEVRRILLNHLGKP